MERKPFVKISIADDGAVLIAYLTARFTYLSADAWRNMLLEGRVSVNGISAYADRKLCAGEVVAFDPPRLEEPEVDPTFAVVMEDEEFLIVDKSGNLPCHPSGHYFQHSLWYILRERYGEVRIATRLDRETSGLVLVCKSRASAAFAQRMLSNGLLEKDYLALVHGRFPDTLQADGYLTEDSASAVRKKRRYADGNVKPQGSKVEACATYFERVRCFAGPISLVRAHPRTGRTHQIRATLCSLGYPLVGDKLYGPDETCFLRMAAGCMNEEDLTRLLLPNQALHCSRLIFKNRAGHAISAASQPRWDAFTSKL